MSHSIKYCANDFPFHVGDLLTRFPESTYNNRHKQQYGCGPYLLLSIDNGASPVEWDVHLLLLETNDKCWWIVTELDICGGVWRLYDGK